MNLKDRIKLRAKERATGEGGGGVFDFEGAGIDNVSFWSPDSEGPFKFDIIPYNVTDDNNLDEVPAGEEWYRKLVLVHYNIGPANKKVVCPRTVGKNCPICEAVSEAYNNGNNEEAKLIKAKEKSLMNIVLDGEDEIKLFLYSTYLFGDPLEREVTHSEEDVFNFASTTDGLQIKVRFEEKSLGSNTYYETERIDFLSRDAQYDPSIVEEAYPLDELIKIMSYKDLEKALYGADAEVLSDEDEEEDAGSSIHEKIVVSNKMDEDEEDDLSYEVEGDEDEKPARPKRPVRRKR